MGMHSVLTTHYYTFRIEMEMIKGETPHQYSSLQALEMGSRKSRPTFSEPSREQQLFHREQPGTLTGNRTVTV